MMEKVVMPRKALEDLMNERDLYKVTLDLLMDLSQKVLEQNNDFLAKSVKLKEENTDLKAMIEDLAESEEESFFGPESNEECDCDYCKLSKEIAEKIAREIEEEAGFKMKVFKLSDLL